ncbi:hypothetical protein C1I98_37775 [Spongiactinospora gelatinilytica]|uniref:Uncharacterized protein n=1 Tax=Spongiactinospora gelatinilytica TaxID=2666298 RepID=A0A2W2ESS9_9ACTN|nr:hypothetical protein [Spongiactinospora gelatinilytica]PZG19849.1 hypothetical protein C1I98_37775 [Spongiactinospora gelatinilytica]
MRARKWLSGASATALLTASVVIGTASSASATPTGCSAQVSGLTASSYCSGGTGEHRVHVLQKHFLPDVGPILILGPWTPVGSTSSTNITPHTIVNVWVTTRG